MSVRKGTTSLSLSLSLSAATNSKAERDRLATVSGLLSLAGRTFPANKGTRCSLRISNTIYGLRSKIGLAKHSVSMT